MLYQFIDKPAISSIQQIIRKRVEVTDSLVVFMSDFSLVLYLSALQLGFKAGTFTFVNLLGSGHTLGNKSLTLTDLIGNDGRFKLLKQDQHTNFYIYDLTTVVKVKLDGTEVRTVTYCYPESIKTDYYCGSLVCTKYKNNNEQTIKTVFYDVEGSPFYTCESDDSYTYKGTVYPSKDDLYACLLKDFSFGNGDTLSLDWAHGYETIICQNKGKAKVVVPFYCEMLNGSSFHTRKNVFEHTNIPEELYYLSKFSIESDKPFCNIRAGAQFIVDNATDIDAIYSQSEEMKIILEQNMEAGLFPKMNVEVYKMLDYQFYPNRSKGNKKVCAVSRLSIEKRIDWIIKSVYLAHNVDPDISLDIYGSGSEEETKLKRLVKGLKAESYITFKGWTKDKTVPRDYALFMNTSLTEGSPLSVHEAIACGCPIVATDIIGHKGLVKKNGILVDFGGKPENTFCLELSKAILEALERFEEFSAESEAFTLKHLNKEVVDDSIRQLFS